jgi:hypothetical protein
MEGILEDLPFILGLGKGGGTRKKGNGNEEH